MSFAVKKKNLVVFIAVVALLFVFRFVLAVCCLLFAVPTPAADMKVADEPQPLLTTADGYWCVARSSFGAGCVSLVCWRGVCVSFVCQRAVCVICVSGHFVCVSAPRKVLVCLPRAGCVMLCLVQV